MIDSYTSIFCHLWNSHKIFYDEKKKQVKFNNEQARLGGNSWAAATSYTQVEKRPFDTYGFQQAAGDWAILKDLSYHQVISKHTRNFISFDWDQMDLALWKSHSTLSNHISDIYQKCFHKIKQLLWSAKSKIHLSWNIWDSGNDHSLLEVVAHFLDKLWLIRLETLRLILIDENDQLQCSLLSLSHLYDHHCDKNIASVIHKLLSRYGILHWTGLYCSDNAGNNDTTIDHLKVLGVDIGRESRLCCAGHIINLICKVLILEQGVSQFEWELCGASDQEIFELWQKHEVIGKVHNIVKYIQQSDQCVDEFNTIQNDVNEEDELFSQNVLMLIKDDDSKSSLKYINSSH